MNQILLLRSLRNGKSLDIARVDTKHFVVFIHSPVIRRARFHSFCVKRKSVLTTDKWRRIDSAKIHIMVLGERAGFPVQCE